MTINELQRRSPFFPHRAWFISSNISTRMSRLGHKPSLEGGKFPRYSKPEGCEEMERKLDREGL